MKAESDGQTRQSYRIKLISWLGKIFLRNLHRWSTCCLHKILATILVRPE